MTRPISRFICITFRNRIYMKFDTAHGNACLHIFTFFCSRQGIKHPTYPFAVFGALGIVGAIAAFMLPETRGRPLPETLEDAERD